MKWWDWGQDYFFIQYFWQKLRVWWAIPNRTERKEFWNHNEEWARQALADARRQEKWLADYEHRPEKKADELADEVIARLKNNPKF